MTEQINAQTLLDKHFETALETPDGIKKLRELILTLAMQGKLVPQDPNDQPASELLKEIEAEKKRLVKEGKLKKPVEEKESHALVFPFKLPVGWAPTTLLGVCTSITDGDHLPPPQTETGVPFLVIGNVRNKTVDFSGCRHVSEDYYKALDHIRQPQLGDVLYTLVGSYGIPILVSNDRHFCVQRHIGILRPSKHVFAFFLTNTLSSQWVFDQASNFATGIAQKTVPLSGLRRISIPLPPLAEQRRIVAKIDQLMALCDTLEAQRKERDEKRLTIHTTAINRLLTAPDQTAFDASWNFLTTHFDELHAVPKTVADLKKAILQLAVMGKLVPQDPNDQPASELLKEIESEMKRLERTGNARKQEAIQLLQNQEAPYQIPTTWKWVCFGSLIENADSGWSPQTTGFPRSGENWGVIKVSAVSWNKFIPEENKQLLPGTNPPEAAAIQKGDYLISRANTGELVAKCVIVEEKPIQLILSDKIVRLRLSRKCHAKYLYIVNNFAEYARDYFKKSASGTSMSMKNVSRSTIYSLPIPLPPLAEQRRIVAKVDQLIALCDTLDKQIISATEKQTSILKAIISKIERPPCA